MKCLVSLLLWSFPLCLFAQQQGNDSSRISAIRFLLNSKSPQFWVSSEAINKWKESYPTLESIAVGELVPYRSGFAIPENGTGRVYFLDSSGNVTRLDDTQNGGDRFGAFNFVFNDTLFSIGGYGFWRVNGAVRFFNTKTKEWNIIKTNENIQVAAGVNAYFAFNQADKKIYVLYRTYLDEYVSTDKKENNQSRLLINIFDLVTKKWNEEPILFNKKIATDFEDIHILYAHNRTIFINSKKYPKTLELNLYKNEVYEAEDPLTIEWVELNRKSPMRINFSSDRSINIYDISNGIVHKIPVKSSNKNSIGKIYDSPTFLEKIKKEWGIITGLIIINILTLLVFLKTYKKNKHKIKSEVENIVDQHTLTARVKNFTDLLDDIEKTAVQHLLKNYKEGKLTSIDEINKILQIEKRPYKIRNNMRADILKLINKKFMDFASSTDELIIRERSTFDKRYFEYTLNDRYANKIGNTTSE